MTRATDTTSSRLERLNGAGWLLLTERERRGVIDSCRLVFSADLGEVKARVAALRDHDSAVGA